MNTPYDMIPGDVVLNDFAERSANPRGQMPARDLVRSWTAGVYPDVDSGRARSTQPDDRPRGEVITAREHGPEITSGRAAARWNARHARFRTS